MAVQVPGVPGRHSDTECGFEFGAVVAGVPDRDLGKTLHPAEQAAAKATSRSLGASMTAAYRAGLRTSSLIRRP
jgi:hypothetical protein